MQIARVVNVGDTTFTDKFDGQEFTIEPGSEAIVPFGAVCLWLGDPSASDSNPKNRERTEAFARLRARYGIYDKEALWDQARPKIEAYTPGGERIITVADDPYGQPAAVSPDDGLGAVDSRLQAKLAEQEARLSEQNEKIDRLLSILGNVDPETLAQAVSNADDPDRPALAELEDEPAPPELEPEPASAPPKPKNEAKPRGRAKKASGGPPEDRPARVKVS